MKASKCNVQCTSQTTNLHAAAVPTHTGGIESDDSEDVPDAPPITLPEPYDLVLQDEVLHIGGVPVGDWPTHPNASLSGAERRESDDGWSFMPMAALRASAAQE